MHSRTNGQPRWLGLVWAAVLLLATAPPARAGLIASEAGAEPVENPTWTEESEGDDGTWEDGTDDEVWIDPVYEDVPGDDEVWIDPVYEDVPADDGAIPDGEVIYFEWDGDGDGVLDGEEVYLMSTQSGPPCHNPEPASLTLLGIGAVGLLGYGWRPRR